MAIGHAASLLVAGLCVAAAVGAGLLLRTTLVPAQPPPRPVPPPADADVGAAAVAAPHAPAAALVAREAVVADATVAGTLRLDRGQPLGGWRVRLQRLDRQPLPPRRLDTEAERPTYAAVDFTTAADGTFTFPGLDAGHYEVRCVGRDDVTTRLSLAARERREIELVASGAAVTCRVLHAGAPLRGTRLRIEGSRSASAFTDDAGVARCLLPPGVYEVSIFGVERLLRPTSVHALRVPSDLAAMAIAFEVGGVDLDVDVMFAAGGVPDQFLLRLDGETDPNGRPVEYSASGRDGRATLPRVPPGRWCVTVLSPALVPVPPCELVVENGMPRASMAFVVAPAASVGLVVRNAGRQPLTVAPSAMPSLLAGDVVLPCEAQVGPPKLVYRSVPAGPALLRIEDRVQGDEQVFLPFDPLPALALDVVLGAPQEIVLDVVPRAFVDVRGCDRTGREDFAAVVRVFAGDRPVKKQPDDKLYRWAAFLPPGDYRVVVERRSGVQEQPLRVERTNVLLRLRP